MSEPTNMLQAPIDPIWDEVARARKRVAYWTKAVHRTQLRLGRLIMDHYSKSGLHSLKWDQSCTFRKYTGYCGICEAYAIRRARRRALQRAHEHLHELIARISGK